MKKHARSGKSQQMHLEDLVSSAEKEFPGITELIKVYGGYEEMIRDVREYLEITSLEPSVTTSNQSSPRTLKS